MRGVSSTYIIQSSILQACVASKCAAILQCLCTWFVSHILNAFRLVLVPSIILWIEHGELLGFMSEDITIEALPSTNTSPSSRSLANVIPSFVDLAYASNTPKRKEIFLHIAPINSPFSFLITTPTSHCPASLNTASSTLTLNHPRFGEHHVVLFCPPTLRLVSLWTLFWWNSST